MSGRINRWQLWKWAIAHDMKPSGLKRRMAHIGRTYLRIFLTCVAYTVVSSYRLLTLPLEPVKVAVLTTWHVLVNTDKVRAMRDALTKRH